MKEVSSLKNKVVIILGSTGLIGKNIVDSFLQSGAKVIGVDINNSLLKINKRNNTEMSLLKRFVQILRI